MVNIILSHLPTTLHGAEFPQAGDPDLIKKTCLLNPKFLAYLCTVVKVF